MNAEAIALEIEHLIKDKSTLKSIQQYLMNHDYGNQNEIIKYYELFEQ